MRLLLLTTVITLVACESESTTKTFNSNPEASITSHNSDATILEGVLTEFRAQVSDPNDAYSDLQVAWYVDESLVCDWVTPDPAGNANCEVSLSPENTRLIVEVRDSQGAGGRDEISLTVEPTNAPQITITAPVVGGSYYSDRLISFSGQITDEEDDPAELTGVWESSIDGSLPIEIIADSDGYFEAATTLSQGEHFLQLTVTDSAGKTATESLTIQVGAENSSPNCQIVSPTDGGAGIVDMSVVFAAQVSDAEIPADQLTVTWASDKDGVLGTAVPTSSGEVSIAYSNLSIETHRITVEVLDEVGESCTDAIMYTVGTPPTLTLNTPTDGEIYSLAESIPFSATVTDSEDSPDLVALSWTSDIDGEFSTQPATSTGTAQFTYGTLSAGTHNIIVTAADTAGLTTSALRTITVNTPPTAPTVSIYPTIADTNDTLIANASGSTDADGQTVSYTYSWLKNGAATTHTTATIAAADTSKGELWTVRVTPNDGYTDGVFAEASIFVDNTPPAVSNVNITPGPAVTVNDTLSCAATVTDPDETPSLSYRWENLNTGLNLGTADSLTLNAFIATADDIIQCTVIAEDGDGETDMGTSSVIVYNSAPVISSVSILPSGPQQGDTLTCSATASDPDGGTLTDTYVWTNITTGTLIGATNTVLLTSNNSSTNDEIQCAVTVTDIDGESTTDSTSVTVTNSTPTVTSITISPSSAGVNDTVSCAVIGSDPDGDTLTESYNWTNLNTGMSIGSGATITLSSSVIARGDTLECTGTLTDPSGASSADSTTISISNTEPSVSTVSINPTSPGVTDTLSCSVNANDPDGDILTDSHQWNNISTGDILGAASNLDLSTVAVSSGHEIQCIVTVSDGYGGTDSSASSITISNSPPVVTTVGIVETSPQTNDILTVSTTTSDADGDTVSLSYNWFVNSISTGHTGDTLNGTTYFNKGDSVHVEVTPNDGFGSGGTVSSLAVVIQNTAPQAPEVTITPTPASAEDDLVCEITLPAFDADGDSLLYTLTWTVDGIAYSGATTTYQAGDTVPAADTSSAEEWICSANANDGSTSGPTASASAQLGDGNFFDGTYGSSWTTLAPSSEDLYSLMNYKPIEYEYLWQSHGNNLSYYDPSTNSWSTVGSSTPYSSPWNTMAPWGGDLWMIRNQSIYSYDIDSDNWTTWGSYSGGDDMNQTDNDYEGKIYGYAANGDVIIYDTVGNTVSQHNTGLGSLFETRLVYDPVYHSLFIGEYSQPQLYRFDLTTYSVTQLADIPENQLNDIFCGDRSGHIYAAGDSSGTTIFQYDIASDVWTQIPSVPGDHGNNGSCTVSEEGYLYVGSGSNRQLYRIDLGMN